MKDAQGTAVRHAVPESHPPFEAILWDMDGTLADSEPVHKLSFELACQALGIKLPADFHDSVLGRSDEETHTGLVEDFGLALSLSDWMAARFAVYRDHIDRVTFLPEAKRLWDHASFQAIPQAIVSNSDRIIVGANLDRLGLSHPGLVSVSRNDVRRGKPHPDPYLRAAKLMGTDPGRIAIVEDSKTGVQSGVAAGMTVFVMPHSADDLPETVRPVSELAERLRTQVRAQ